MTDTGPYSVQITAELTLSEPADPVEVEESVSSPEGVVDLRAHRYHEDGLNNKRRPNSSRLGAAHTRRWIASDPSTSSNIRKTTEATDRYNTTTQPEDASGT